MEKNVSYMYGIFSLALEALQRTKANDIFLSASKMWTLALQSQNNFFKPHLSGNNNLNNNFPFLCILYVITGLCKTRSQENMCRNNFLTNQTSKNDVRGQVKQDVDNVTNKY